MLSKLELTTAITEQVLQNLNIHYENPWNMQIRLLNPNAYTIIKQDIASVLRHLERNSTLQKIYYELEDEARLNLIQDIAGHLTLSPFYTISTSYGLDATGTTKIYLNELDSAIIKIYMQKISVTALMVLVALPILPISLPMFLYSLNYPSGPSETYYATHSNLKNNHSKTTRAELITFHFLNAIAKIASAEELITLTHALDTVKDRVDTIQPFKMKYGQALKQLNFFSGCCQTLKPLALFFRIISPTLPKLPEEILYSVQLCLNWHDFMILASLNKTMNSELHASKLQAPTFR